MVHKIKNPLAPLSIPGYKQTARTAKAPSTPSTKMAGVDYAATMRAKAMKEKVANRYGPGGRSSTKEYQSQRAKAFDQATERKRKANKPY